MACRQSESVDTELHLITSPACIVCPDKNRMKHGGIFRLRYMLTATTRVTDRICDIPIPAPAINPINREMINMGTMPNIDSS